VLAFYSRVKAAPSKLMWSLNLPDWKAKLLTMYLNSTFNILQTLLLRSETRGAFMEISKYILSEFKVPDLEQFSEAKVKRLIATFNLIRDAKLPSILEQLKTKHPVRRTIDIVWLDAMDMKEEKNRLSELYELLADEIQLLKNIMDEGPHNEAEERLNFST
jgi:hypothetical protein